MNYCTGDVILIRFINWLESKTGYKTHIGIIIKTHPETKIYEAIISGKPGIIYQLKDSDILQKFK